MFTGIIEETGIIRSRRQTPSGASLLIEAERIAHTLKPGDSVAVNGVCLTAAEIHAQAFSCDLSGETLRRTSLGKAREGTVVNLERPLAVGDRLGGHIVQGHVDGVGRLTSVLATGESAEMEFSVPEEFLRYLVIKGSVAVDGISLTVAELKKNGFAVAIIPLTFRATNLRRLKPGDPVNLEADVLAKYFERFFQLGMARDQTANSVLTVEKLKKQGY